MECYLPFTISRFLFGPRLSLLDTNSPLVWIQTAVNWKIAYHDYAFDTSTGFFCQMVSTQAYLIWGDKEQYLRKIPNKILVC